MKTENKEIVELLRECLVVAHGHADRIAASAQKETGQARAFMVSDFVAALERISRIEAQIARYQ